MCPFPENKTAWLLKRLAKDLTYTLPRYCVHKKEMIHATWVLGIVYIIEQLITI